MRLRASLDQLAGAPGCFSGCAPAKASIVESDLAIRVKFKKRRGVSVAVAIAAGGSVFHVLFERGKRSGVPMLAPFDAGRLIELEFMFQIFAHARHDQRV